MFSYYDISEWQDLPLNTKRIFDTQMPPNHQFNMDLARPSSIFNNPTYRPAEYDIYGTLNCSMKGEINGS